MAMIKTKRRLAAAILAAAFTLPMTQASHGSAVVVAPPAVAGGGSGLVGVGIFAGIVAALTSYDIIRRNTCSGDFLKLGGPGFGEPIRPTQNVQTPPACSQR